MSRNKKPRMEYRYYEVPEKCPVLVLQGEKWLQNYGYQIDYLHFHNLMEIGFCYYGGAEKLSAYNKLKRKQCMFLGMGVCGCGRIYYRAV